MVISISVVLLLSVLALIFLRHGTLRLSHAILCMVLGFYLAGSSAAPPIAEGLSATADLVSSVRP